MKNGIRQILGKRIVAAIGKERYGKAPAGQLMLVFDDGTWYEIWCAEYPLSVASGVNAGGFEAALDYMAETADRVDVQRLEDDSGEDFR